MKEFINKIGKGTKLLINGKTYSIDAKAKYVTQKNPREWYVKIFLHGHYALVMSPSDDFIYFGKDVGSIGIDEPFNKQIVYDKKKYSLIGEDYQIMINLEFGSPLTTEGEVEFWDYVCSTDENKIISIGIIKRTAKRADIVARVISLDDIQLIQEESRRNE